MALIRAWQEGPERKKHKEERGKNGEIVQVCVHDMLHVSVLQNMLDSTFVILLQMLSGSILKINTYSLSLSG